MNYPGGLVQGKQKSIKTRHFLKKLRTSELTRSIQRTFEPMRTDYFRQFSNPSDVRGFVLGCAHLTDYLNCRRTLVVRSSFGAHPNIGSGEAHI